jgi:hypothetical protein
VVIITLKFVGLKIAFLDNDGNSMPDQADASQASSSRSRGNTDFSNHTWVPVPDNGTVSKFMLANAVVKFFDETEDISRIMSSINVPTAPLTSSEQQSGLKEETMDYETMLNSFNTVLTSPFGPTTNQSPFSTTQTSPFQTQTSPSTSSNLALEQLVLNESPATTFNAPSSQSTGSHPFGEFDAAMANFTTGIPIESMLDVSSLGEPAYFQSSNVVTEQTARLMRHYIDNLASWMDLSDSRTHFSTVVPKRALTSVVL